MIHAARVKGIVTLLAVGVCSGLLFSGSKYQLNMIIFPFAVPLITAAISSYFAATRWMSWTSCGIWGFISILMSTLVSIVVYSSSVGWLSFINDAESQGVYILTICAQTITYFISMAVFFLIKKIRESRDQCT